MNVLIIEDDSFFATQLSNTFLKSGFANRVDHISSYHEFLSTHLYISSYDILLLDINLGDAYVKKGFDILINVRKNHAHIPIIIISSHSGYNFLEEAFEKGAHDYIVKPFRNRELQIRIQRWFRNYLFSEYFSLRHSLDYGDLKYDISANIFYYKEKSISLSRGNKYILSLFLIYRERLITHDFLIEKIWGNSDTDYNKNLRIKIMRLKNQLKICNIDTWIQNINGEGYVFKNANLKSL